MTENGKKIKAKHIKISFAVITLLFVFTLAGFAWLLSDSRDLSHKTAHLAIENQNRVIEIQKSRVSSCKRTYAGVREVLYPFFPKKKNRTKTQQDNIDKLNANIIRLQNTCVKQTKPITNKKKSNNN